MRDINQIAKSIADEVEKEMNPATVALGRMGGLKGGKACAQKLSSERWKEIANKAAAQRWTR